MARLATRTSYLLGFLDRAHSKPSSEAPEGAHKQWATRRLRVEQSIDKALGDTGRRDRCPPQAAAQPRQWPIPLAAASFITNDNSAPTRYPDDLYGTGIGKARTLARVLAWRHRIFPGSVEPPPQLEERGRTIPFPEMTVEQKHVYERWRDTGHYGLSLDYVSDGAYDGYDNGWDGYTTTYETDWP